MHIGVDATSWQNARGYGRYLRALLRAMVSIDVENRYTLFLDSQEGAADLPAGTRTRVLGASKPAAVAAAANGRRSLTDMWMVSRAMSAEKCDLLLFPTIYTYVPVFTRAKKLVVIHDVIAETHPALTLPDSGGAAVLEGQGGGRTDAGRCAGHGVRLFARGDCTALWRGPRAGVRGG